MRDSGKVTVDFLADHLGTSKETIRRDLTELSLRGQIRKYHGGAERLDRATEGEFRARLHEQAEEKHAIGRLAASLFDRDDTLFVDTGTTTLAFAEELAARPSMTIVTNSLAITQTLARSPEKHRVFLIGGEYLEEASENVGPLAVEQIAQFTARDAVITVGAIDATGAMDYELREAEIARAMISQARRVTIIADDTKLNRTALFRVCQLNQIHRLVVNTYPEPHLAEALTNAGVEILVPSSERKVA
ncbi:DeoR family transcriptional regulator, glycerol-3-phosphate regulon repressor [Paraburkholderia phenoliruptrix BR3459a]|uniref:DeoR family transcriptional regulator, glycerol-3-phosphate regulon repressor n=1 Tax=Paraburkholderia phenoliruptrix BR3459a TaxID=1229205 RepID=K0DN13_9BURK|nr:DeoR family transcriptional regulator, glycerol-3-phosphate regulon repressor [Paraburkholderia phenoliruptrix BR3459a]